MRSFLAIGILAFTAGSAWGGDGNRLAYLDDPCDPYYVHGGFPKLATPQWVGEEGVEAVVVLAIDDMRDPARYEAYLRPILNRLKQIDNRAPVSIMACTVDPQAPQLQTWLEEGLSIECHTIDHPCPLLQGGDFAKAKSTYDRCVALMNQIPGNQPVAFRMPCCDSRNTPSPRFWTQIFNSGAKSQALPARSERDDPFGTDALRAILAGQGPFLSIDSSVFCVLTSQDQDLPRELTLDDDGERFRKYLPFPSFVNTIENYPYPYIIGRRCWEFPCIVPSDWEAQNLHQPNNPRTVEDLKAALDAVVLKQGVFDLVFHPHGWIRAEQVVELIDHAVAKHRNKVKFLTFREALDRLNENLLGGYQIRNDAAHVKLLDLNADGWMDLTIAGRGSQRTRVWAPRERRWRDAEFPVSWPADVQFGVMEQSKTVMLSLREPNSPRAWRFASGRWVAEDRWTTRETTNKGLATLSQDPFGSPPDISLFRDLDGDGSCELIYFFAEDSRSEVLRWDAGASTWRRLPWTLPPHTGLVTRQGRDAGLRFVDLDRDGDLDVLFSNHERYSLHLFDSMKTGWSIPVHAAQRAAGDAIPPLVRPDGTNNGAWLHSGHLWVQNEDTARLPDFVDRRSFADLLAPLQPSPPK